MPTRTFSSGDKLYGYSDFIFLAGPCTHPHRKKESKYIILYVRVSLFLSWITKNVLLFNVYSNAMNCISIHFNVIVSTKNYLLLLFG